MTACVALGIAVDDTTHFMLRFQDLKRAGSIKPSAALRIAFHQCSRAMFHTTMITGTGLSVFLISPLTTMTRFAAMLIVLIGIALACDLVLLPSLLKAFRYSSDSGKS
jgi:predicted RND superfamily exporter protein